MSTEITTGGVAMGKTVAHRFPYPSKTDPKKSYECLVYTDGMLSCNCPGWTRRVDKDGIRSCKHTQLTDVAVGLLNRAVGGLSIPSSKHSLPDPTANNRRKFNFA